MSNESVPIQEEGKNSHKLKLTNYNEFPFCNDNENKKNESLIIMSNFSIQSLFLISTTKGDVVRGVEWQKASKGSSVDPALSADHHDFHCTSVAVINIKIINGRQRNKTQQHNNVDDNDYFYSLTL